MPACPPRCHRHRAGTCTGGSQAAARANNRDLPTRAGGRSLGMTATLSRGRQRTRAMYAVERLKDREAIRNLLWSERAYAAYALEQLDPGLFRLLEWFAVFGLVGAGLVLHFRGGLGLDLFVLVATIEYSAAISLNSAVCL